MYQSSGEKNEGTGIQSMLEYFDLHAILSRTHKSEFFINNFHHIEALKKKNPYWPLEKCRDMVS